MLGRVSTGVCFGPLLSTQAVVHARRAGISTTLRFFRYECTTASFRDSPVRRTSDSCLLTVPPPCSRTPPSKTDARSQMLGADELGEREGEFIKAEATRRQPPEWPYSSSCHPQAGRSSYRPSS